MNIKYKHKETKYIISIEDIKQKTKRGDVNIVLSMSIYTLESVSPETKSWTYRIKEIPLSDDFEVIQEVFDKHEFEYLRACINKCNLTSYSRDCEPILNKINSMYFDCCMEGREV